MNFHQWTEVTSINAARAKETQIRKEIESTPSVALKKQSLDVALADKGRAEADEKTICSQNDGTKVSVR